MLQGPEIDYKLQLLALKKGHKIEFQRISYKLNRIMLCIFVLQLMIMSLLFITIILRETINETILWLLMPSFILVLLCIGLLTYIYVKSFLKKSIKYSDKKILYKVIYELFDDWTKTENEVIIQGSFIDTFINRFLFEQQMLGLREQIPPLSKHTLRQVLIVYPNAQLFINDISMWKNTPTNKQIAILQKEKEEKMPLILPNEKETIYEITDTKHWKKSINTMQNPQILQRIHHIINRQPGDLSLNSSIINSDNFTVNKQMHDISVLS